MQIGEAVDRQYMVEKKPENLSTVEVTMVFLNDLNICYHDYVCMYIYISCLY